MRMSTRNDLLFLSKKMVDTFHLEKVLGTNEFLPMALDLSEELGIPLTKQTLTKYESELKRICKSMMTTEETIEEEAITEWQTPKKEIKALITLYKDGTYNIEKPKEETQIKIPEYTMFAEGEDGLIVLKGTYKGKLVEEIDQIAGWTGCAKGWAKYMLQNDKDLTEDDRGVFNKILLGLL